MPHIKIYIFSTDNTLTPIMQRKLSMNKYLRWFLLLLMFALLYFLGKVLGLDQYLHSTRLREAVAAAGVFGPLLFVAIFIGAVLAQIPGIPFVLLAPALFHWPTALLLCLFASNAAVIINFELVRRIGGNALVEIKQPRLQRILASLETRPVRAVFLLRLLTLMFPPLTSALALTNLKSRDHAIGSALGMIAPILLLLAIGALLTH
jgi:uncharacterized membrane protein YdjX (TVP38/TMEM64 family)